VITGENINNTTMNGMGSTSGKERPILNKIEKGEFLIKDSKDRTMSFKEFKELIYDDNHSPEQQNVKNLS